MLNVIRRGLILSTAIVFSMYAGTVWAAYPDMETFENDADVDETGFDYVPGQDVNYDYLSDNDLGGVPPRQYLWSELRENGQAGIIEEVPTGWAGITASHGDSFGALYFEGADGPKARPSQQVGSDFP